MRLKSFNPTKTMTYYISGRVRGLGMSEVEGIYTAYLTGAAGQGMAMFVFKGAIVKSGV